MQLWSPGFGWRDMKDYCGNAIRNDISEDMIT